MCGQGQGTSMPKVLWVWDDRKGLLLFLTYVSLGKDRALLNVRGNKNRRKSLTVVNMPYWSTLFSVNWFAIETGSGNNYGNPSWRAPLESSRESCFLEREGGGGWGWKIKWKHYERSVQSLTAWDEGANSCGANSSLNSWFFCCCCWRMDQYSKRLFSSNVNGVI